MMNRFIIADPSQFSSAEKTRKSSSAITVSCNRSHLPTL